MKGVNYPIKPGVLEVYCGPMKSGKTKWMILRVDRIDYIKKWDYMFVKPVEDTRDAGIRSRYQDKEQKCHIIEGSNPEKILKLLTPKIGLVAIEEAHFVNDDISDVVHELLRKDINVVIAGLDLDFRGEPFPNMSYLLSIANQVTKLTGVCDDPRCDNDSTRTQRLIKGKPANYNDSTLLTEGANPDARYETRCLKHHVVPGKPKKI